MLPPSVLPDVSPTRGEISFRRGSRPVVILGLVPRIYDAGTARPARLLKKSTAADPRDKPEDDGRVWSAP